nr:LOW QUALITY PROTEIN: interleukin-36 beta [Aotus nancymaae]
MAMYGILTDASLVEEWRKMDSVRQSHHLIYLASFTKGSEDIINPLEVAPKSYVIHDSQKMMWVLSGNSLIAPPLSRSVKPVALDLIACRDREFGDEKKGNVVYLGIKGKELCLFCAEIQDKPTLQLQGSQDNLGKETCWNLVGIHTCINLDMRGSCSMGTLDQWGMRVGRKKWKSFLQHHHLRKKYEDFPSMWTNIGMPGRM